jgi:hypothetical protein
MTSEGIFTQTRPNIRSQNKSNIDHSIWYSFGSKKMMKTVYEKWKIFSDL